MNINFDGLVCYLNAKPSSKKQEQWIDSSSNNNNAILTNVSDNDFNGEYIQFTGNNYATLPRCIQDDFTISAEVVLERSTSTNDAAQAWFSYAALIDAEASGIRNDFGLTISKDGHAYFGVGNPDQTISYTQQSLFNKKHVITCTRHKTTGAIALYIDGNLIKKHFHPNKSSLTYSPSIYIGKGINNKYLLMKLFSVRLYNRVLNEFEIKQDMFLIKEKEYVNNNNLPKIVEKLSAASNIKITGNKYGNRVQTVIDKIVEKADNVTKAINQEVVNNAHSFKAGTGNNVNVSSDVQDSFSEIAIKGQTYQNLYPKLNRSNYKNIYESVKFDGDIIKFTANGTWQNIFLKKEALMVKPSTTYTLVIDILKNTIVNTQSDSMLYLLNTSTNFSDQRSCFTSQIELKKNATIGRYKFQVNTKNDLSVAGIATRCFLDTYASSGELWIKYSLLEGDHANNPNLPSYFEGIVGVGDGSKNLFNPKNATNGYVSSTGQIVDNSNDIRTNYISIKPNTPYIGQSQGNSKLNNYSWFDSAKNFIKRDSNNGSAVSPTNAKYLIYHNQYKPAGEADINKAIIQIEEGMTSTPYEPWHDGYKIPIVSNGKNLFSNINNFITGGNGFSQTIGKSVTLNAIGDANHKYLRVKLPIGKKYTVTIDKRNIYPNDWGNTIVESVDDNIVVGGTYRTIAKSVNSSTAVSVLTFETTLPYVYIHVGRRTEPETQEEWFAKVLNSFKTLQIEENDTASFVETYKQDRLQLLLDQPLMKLPNGVYDEITKDGKLIRRIDKIVLDGSEGWYTANALDNTKNYFIANNLINNCKQTINYSFDNQVSDNLIIKNPYEFPTESCIWALWQEQASRIRISIKGVTDIKTWLKQNPTTLYYELQNPIITDLSSNQIKLFKDGHLTFNTLVAPESTHIVQLNKSAQIQNTIKQSQLLDNKIAVLENNYDSLMLSTMSTLNNLELDYTLK